MLRIFEVLLSLLWENCELCRQYLRIYSGTNVKLTVVSPLSFECPLRPAHPKYCSRSEYLRFRYLSAVVNKAPHPSNKQSWSLQSYHSQQMMCSNVDNTNPWQCTVSDYRQLNKIVLSKHCLVSLYKNRYAKRYSDLLLRSWVILYCFLLITKADKIIAKSFGWALTLMAFWSCFAIASYSICQKAGLQIKQSELILEINRHRARGMPISTN